MSQIPAPPVLPKPKALSKGNDVATAEHDALLRRVWRNLEGMVGLLYANAQAKFDGSASYAVQGYLRACKAAADHTQKWAGDFSDDPKSGEIKALADRLSSISESFVPALTVDLFEPTIVERTLAAPLREHKEVAGRKKVSLVGFVDIECAIEIPAKLELRDNLPSFVIPHSIFFHERSEERVSTNDIRKAPVVPYWHMETERFSLWIDIRIKPQPLGQLLRELKTLRNYLYSGDKVCVVMPSLDSETRSFLRAEGFIALDCEWLGKNGFV